MRVARAIDISLAACIPGEHREHAAKSKYANQDKIEAVKVGKQTWQNEALDVLQGKTVRSGNKTQGSGVQVHH